MLVSPIYDPHRHADELGLTVVYQPLRTGHGLYVPGRDIIILRPRLKAAVERSVLAHEVAHHLHAHRRTTGVWSIRQERQADLTAARNLIDPARLRHAQRCSPDPAEWCRELDITGDLLLAFLRAA